ncbi:unknown [Prevotella sp. CAG:1124]|nr:unknown [Prevotella sp. CAG:1124]
MSRSATFDRVTASPVPHSPQRSKHVITSSVSTTADNPSITRYALECPLASVTYATGNIIARAYMANTAT